jgi:ATP-dependent Clp protease ATP-binding subunit ClpA
MIRRLQRLVGKALDSSARRRAQRDFVCSSWKSMESALGGDIEIAPEVEGFLEFVFADSAARNHDYVGTEHLLLAMVQFDCVARDLLVAMNLDGAKIQAQLEGKFESQWKWKAVDISAPLRRLRALTPRGLGVFSLSTSECRRLEHRNFHTGHLILGVCRVGNGNAAVLLQDLGVRFESLVDHVKDRPC